MREKIINHFSRLLLLKLLVYFSVFMYCINTEAIYSYDTYDYLRAMPYRQLGYVLFVKGFGFIFGGFFDYAVVGFQALFSLFAVHYFLKNVSALFSLNLVSKLLLLAILIFPFFEPLSIANNICSEGLSYGLYLILITLGINILFNHKLDHIKYFAIIYIALVFVRGQFLFTTLIFAFTYIIVYKTELKSKKHLLNIIVLVTVPLVISISERTYHKLKDGVFKATPFSFVNASTAAFYVSNQSDVNFIKNSDDKAIFTLSYKLLEEKKLLLSSQNNSEQPYMFFHNNMPKICNQTVHVTGINYYQAKDNSIANAYFNIEASCKNITLTLIKNNFSKWIRFYYANISYGLYSPLLVFVLLFIFIFSFIKMSFTYNKWYGILFLLSSLILANAMLVAFASHSIIRYLFYNYALFFLIVITIQKLFKHEPKP
ncbi:MAG: hypothetical protein ACPGUH_08220 [Winogradskyella sp.]